MRPETPADEDEIRAVVVSAFGQPLVGELVDGRRASPDWINGLSFVTERQGRIVGHVLFTRSLLDARRRLVEALVLSPLAVIPGEQATGVGSALVEHGVKTARAQPEPLVFLEGSPTYYLGSGSEQPVRSASVGRRSGSGARVPGRVPTAIRAMDDRNLGGLAGVLGS